MASTFDPEYVNAFEIGTKNTLLNGALRLNTTAFFYDYKDYQVSQIVDRISLNENFDATIWGLELEAVYRPTPSFQIDGNFGYLKTRIADGESSINVMDRTQGKDGWSVVRPWIQVPSNCIAPTEYVERILNSPFGPEFATSRSAPCAQVRLGSARSIPIFLPFCLSGPCTASRTIR